MIIVLFLAILTLLALYANPFIRKHNTKIYIAATLLSILAFIFRAQPIATPFIQGFLGLSFFYIVMITGAIDKKHLIRTKFMTLRREYSIIGFIVITPHALNYTIQGLDGTRSLEWFGVISFLLMIPLFVTSFIKIRKKMSSKTWYRIQSAAYIIYLLLFIHLILNFTQPINLVLYLFLFILYFVLKTIKFVKTGKLR
ncbi:ferric reductase-like transmembrane domain-containing protein [Paracholeplasma manati]|uniref:ferric reductase-like transmembrane domain-containing protein n=1 Tax=Paracholeplasma manati TaxID=591373 RepID=UPI002407FF8E|nr:ferric reductase-like transmembrane domain-containing protein [Paracholeplasma manati]MDG0888303.1 ferric reductase-like transmembrane domain-containing protein [Paracholeplasma manati]